MKTTLHTRLFRALLMAVLMVATTLSASAYDFMVDGLAYNINEDSTSVSVTYEIANEDGPSNVYSNLSGAIEIPSNVVYNGISYSVTSIGRLAFYKCQELTSVVIPNSVTEISDYAFDYCTGLTSVAIPDSVTKIGDYAFHGCSGLTSLIMGNSVTSIGEQAFSLCSGLTSLTIPNSVNSIGSDAFSSTPWYNNQPDGLVYAGMVAYKYKGQMPSGTSIVLQDGCNGIAVSAFGYCTGLTSVTIPNSVTTIGAIAFRYCTGLTSITIPNSVTFIGEQAFSCTSLNSIVVDSGNPKYDSRDNCNAIIETETNNLMCGSNTTIIPNSVTKIGIGAFYNFRGLTSITIPNSVTSIGEYAFFNCTGLTSVIIGNSVNSIDELAFGYCSALTSVTIGNSVTSIGNYTFSDCHNLMLIRSYLRKPQYVSYGYSIFNGCSHNCIVYVPHGTKSDYETISTWNYFVNITELELTADVNDDGNVTAADVTTLYDYLLNNDTSNLVDGDVDGDGNITAADITAIYNMILGEQ